MRSHGSWSWLLLAGALAGAPSAAVAGDYIQTGTPMTCDEVAGVGVPQRAASERIQIKLTLNQFNWQRSEDPYCSYPGLAEVAVYRGGRFADAWHAKNRCAMASVTEYPQAGRALAIYSPALEYRSLDVTVYLDYVDLVSVNSYNNRLISGRALVRGDPDYSIYLTCSYDYMMQER
jgi:hypothetical protein